MHGFEFTDSRCCGTGRRGFLKQLAVGGTTLAAVSRTPLSGNAVSGPAGSLPTIKIADKQISRLVLGSNPFKGIAYSTKNLQKHMQAFYTADRVAEVLLHAERQGITAFESPYTDILRAALPLARERGGKIQWIATISHKETILEEALKLKPIAVVHHGGVADLTIAAGQKDKVRGFVKRVHDKGVTAGVSTHDPDHLALIADEDWENAFFHTCFYFLTRSQEEIAKRLGDTPIDLVFYEHDPERMTKVVRQVQKPCLGFKILAAGRKCWNAEMLEKAFSFAYQNIKPIDGVIVGMYQAFKDEVAENARMALKLTKPDGMSQ